MEWSKNNQYNSFNSYKGLTYYENYGMIKTWLDTQGESKLPPPVECNLDPVAECNLKCYFCITQRYLCTNRGEVGEMRKLPKDYMLKLVDFLDDWGVRGLCISGGGEPSLHSAISGVIWRAVLNGLDVAFVTNAVLMPPVLKTALLDCRWVALSVDATNPETYKKVKGVDVFDKVIKNIENLTNLREKNRSNVDLCFKYLVLPENVQGIYKACLLAKGLGVQDFHVRPVDFERSDIEGHKQLSIFIPTVKEQFELCHELEDENFHVYTVTHKFDGNFHVKHDFNRCLATPLILPLLTDGNGYLCVDKKMEARYRLGSGYPDPQQIQEWWGSRKHWQMIQKVKIEHCSRCTWSQYNKQMEKVVYKDGMCLSFP